MLKLATTILILASSLMAFAECLTLQPSFQVGDTLRYRATADVRMRHETDSMHSVTIMLPQVYIESKNDKGYVILTSNSLEEFDIENSDPTGIEFMDYNSSMLNDIVSAIRLKVQLDENNRPDSIINMDEMKNNMLEAYQKLFEKQTGRELTTDPEWENDTKPLIAIAINAICDKDHLLDEQFNNIAYFNLIGIPLKSEEIPSSLILTDELQRLCPDLTTLSMEIQNIDNIEGCGTIDHKYHSIIVKGKNENSNIYGKWLFTNGNLTQANLLVSTKSNSETITGIYTIESL